MVLNSKGINILSYIFTKGHKVFNEKHIEKIFNACALYFNDRLSDSTGYQWKGQD